jgi:3-phosphoshikimate 1-carboxyvinyltransferase
MGSAHPEVAFGMNVVPLPDLIEILPLHRPVRAQITVPGSKSITNRALVLAALASGETTLRGALWSEDTQVMVECLQELGFMVNVAPDPDDSSNRTITVYGQAGTVPAGGTEEQPLDLFVGNAGTTARFLAAFLCLGKGVFRLHGVPRMHERPQAALFAALRELGYRIEATADKLPALVYGGGRHSGKCRVSVVESSQFASALLLAGGKDWELEVIGANEEEQPYVAMTRALIKVFPRNGGTFRIEPDASSGSYFLGANWLLRAVERAGALASGGPGAFLPGASPQEGGTVDPGLSDISVPHWPTSGWQVDARLRELLFTTVPATSSATSLAAHRNGWVSSPFPGEISRKHDLGDSIMTAIVLAPFAAAPVKFTDLGRLRVQECERVVALRTELTKCGARVVEEGDTLSIQPSPLHGAEIETYNDHRMAMCFAILGLKVPGIKIKNPSCVKKTFPNFFQKLAKPAPGGLGAVIRHPAYGQVLGSAELVAG